MTTRRLPLTLIGTLVAVLTVGAACSRGDEGATAGDTVAPVPPTTVAPVTVAPSTVPATPVPTTAPTTVVPGTAAPTSGAPTTTTPMTVAPTTAAPTTVAPTTGPPTTVAPVDHAVTVHHGQTPIGVWDGVAWQYPAWGPDFLPTLTAPTSALVLTGLDLPAPISGASLGPLDYFCVGDEQSHSVELPPGVDTGEARYIAVTADWNVQPRPVRLVGAENPEYATVGAALVDPASGADPAAGVVRRVVRADLDGNGVEEVLVEYVNQTPDAPFGTAGDYTLIIARYPHADGSVDDVVLWSYYEQEPIDFPDPADAEIVAVADLNGDAVMEVVVGETAWEQSAMTVHALVDGRLAAVTGGGCGV